MSVYVLGLLSALAFAGGLVLQQRGTLQTSAPEGDPRFLREVVRKPVWLAGIVLLLVGWFFQAWALKHGTLALVQSLQALSLVFALPLGVWLTDQIVGRRSIIAALVTVAGIVLLVAVGQPHGGISQPSRRAWLVSAVVIFGVMAVLLMLGYRRRQGPAAALFGTAAGLAFAFQAGVTKELVAHVSQGWAAVFLSWPLYVFIVVEIIGFTLQQTALKTACLAPATAALNATTLGGSVILGATAFHEAVSHGPGRLGPAIVGLLMAIAGVVTLASVDQRCPLVPSTEASTPAE